MKKGGFFIETETYTPKQIYDRIFKRIFSLSDTAIINLINGLFHRNFPADSKISYLNREFVKFNLESILHISFGSQGSFDYHVKNFIYLEHDINELYHRKMVALIPFQVLRFRRLMETQYPDNFNHEPYFNSKEFLELQDSIHHDIINSIHINLHLNNITTDDANQLLELTNFLYEHICNDFKTKVKGAVDKMKPLLPGAIELPNDKYRFRIDELEKEIAKYADENARYADEVLALKRRIRELEANSN